MCRSCSWWCRTKSSRKATRSMRRCAWRARSGRGVQLRLGFDPDHLTVVDQDTGAEGLQFGTAIGEFLTQGERENIQCDDPRSRTREPSIGGLRDQRSAGLPGRPAGGVGVRHAGHHPIRDHGRGRYRAGARRRRAASWSWTTSSPARKTAGRSRYVPATEGRRSMSRAKATIRPGSSSASRPS